MTEARRGRGAPRRGPITDKTASIATKVRPDTLVRLQATAEADGMSVSQAIETLLVRVLDQQDTFGRHFKSPWRAFEARMLANMPNDADDLRAWSNLALELVGRLESDLKRSVGIIANEIKEQQETIAPVFAVPPMAAKGVRAKSSRVLDLKD